MGSIDAELLCKAMDGARYTKKRLADELGLSIQYVTDITKGRRKLKRNPEMRARIAQVLDVPQHWIEHRDVAS